MLGGQYGNLRSEGIDGIEPLGGVQRDWSKGMFIGCGTGGIWGSLVPVGRIASRIAVLGVGGHVEMNQRCCIVRSRELLNQIELNHIA